LLHPRPLQKAESLPLADFYSGQQPDNLAASVVDYCSGVLRHVDASLIEAHIHFVQP